MRTGTRRKDGTMALAKADEGLIDVRRYRMVREDGLTIVDIARMENVAPSTVQDSVKRGRVMYETEQQMQLRDAKYESALENEKFRKRLRNKVDTKIEDAIETLLTGKKIVVGIDPKTGEINTQEITDPEVIAMGVEAASKILALNEKPASTQVAINMNTQINNNDGPQRADLTYEDMLDRISERQRGDRPRSKVIETEALDVTDVTGEQEPF